MLFELDDVCLSRAGRQVLDGFSARVPDGISALVGPSGAGKSTTLRLLDRLTDPDSGTVRYGGVDVRDLDPLELRREVMLVPQVPALLEGTVADNLTFAARLAGRELAAGEVTALLGLTGLEASFAERDGARLSVGERQRAMLARALALEPRVLLLDEPTSALDGEARDAIEATIASLAGELGVSIVLVTHDLEQAGRLAGWIVRMDTGRSTGEGSAVELLQA